MDKLRAIFRASPLFVIMGFITLGVVLYDPLNWLILNIWCGLYGLGDPYKFWG